MIRIYGKDNCSWCEKAKKLLESREIPFQYYTIDKDVSRSWILEEYPFIKTVPIIIDNGGLIGGYDQLLEKVTNVVGFGKALLVE